jgi:Tol biopolymer transport system component
MRFAVVGVATALLSITSAVGAPTRAQAPPIVFTSGLLDRDLVVMDADGAHRRTVTPNGRDDSDPSWSPDRSRIAFSFFDGRRERVAVLDLRTREVRNLGEGFNPDWSPDGKRLVFVDASDFEDLVTMNADGTGRRNLGLQGAGIADETEPAWSPDGRRIAFVGDGLYVVAPDGSGLRRVRPEGGSGSATWSPNGRRIAFDCAAQPFRFEVCTVRLDGRGFRGLARSGRHPHWSPRGNLIALTLEGPPQRVLLVRPSGKLVRRIPGVANADWSSDGRRMVAEHELPSGLRLYATDTAGGPLARFTQSAHVIDQTPAWSPDGTSIAFRRRQGQRCSLAVLRGASRRVHVVVARTRTGRCYDRPDWSRDGRTLLYSSGGDLWTVRSTGGDPRRLTRTRGWERSPRFAPDGRSIGFLDRTGISLLKPDGSRTRLVAEGGPFAWSHDGLTLAYSLYDGTAERFDLYLRTGDGPPRRLFEGIASAPTWSPDDKRLAFVREPSDPREGLTLVVVDLAGQATTVPIFDEPGGPDWRP